MTNHGNLDRHGNPCWFSHVHEGANFQTDTIFEKWFFRYQQAFS